MNACVSVRVLWASCWKISELAVNIHERLLSFLERLQNACIFVIKWK